MNVSLKYRVNRRWSISDYARNLFFVYNILHGDVNPPIEEFFKTSDNLNVVIFNLHFVILVLLSCVTINFVRVIQSRVKCMAAHARAMSNIQVVALFKTGPLLVVRAKVLSVLYCTPLWRYYNSSSDVVPVLQSSLSFPYYDSIQGIAKYHTKPSWPSLQTSSSAAPLGTL